MITPLEAKKERIPESVSPLLWFWGESSLLSSQDNKKEIHPYCKII